MSGFRLGPEDIVQARILEWIEQAAPDVEVFHVPNGGKRGMQEALKFKAIGVVRGVADLVVLAPGKTVFIEVKSKAGSVAPEQRSWGLRVQALGHYWFVAKGDSAIDDCRKAFKAVGIETREAA